MKRLITALVLLPLVAWGQENLESTVADNKSKVTGIAQRVETLETGQLVQDGRLEAIAVEQATQNNRLNQIEDEQVVQNNRLAALEALEVDDRLTSDEQHVKNWLYSNASNHNKFTDAIRALYYDLMPCDLSRGGVFILACGQISTSDGEQLHLGSAGALWVFAVSGTGRFSSLVFLGQSTTTHDWTQLRAGRQANYTRNPAAFGGRPVLVDSCTQPTVELVPNGSLPTNGFGLDNGHVYRLDFTVYDNLDEYGVPIPTSVVNVTGGTYGRINYLPNNPYVPMCETVTDAIGDYAVYPILFQADTSGWGTVTGAK